MRLIGPFARIIPLSGLPPTGPISDDNLIIVTNGGVLVDGERIVQIGPFFQLKKTTGVEVEEIAQPMTLLPGFIDAHTHICFAGSRARDYALRVAGVSYLEIARQGGGILDTVGKTRRASKDELARSLSERCDRQLRHGITTCEVKSGYGLSVEHEIKMLEVIREVNNRHAIDLVSSCLAAHVVPKEFSDAASYLNHVTRELLPQVASKKLSGRVDVFVEEGAFSVDQARSYLSQAKKLGFSLVVHADQFSPGGSRLACETGAVSADHLEASGEAEMRALAKAGVVATVLPGASLGLGVPFAPARKLLDHGCILAIASDWNPGSAPMGDLLTQAAVLGAAQKLTLAETFAGITFRAARALALSDRGVLAPGMLADMVAFPCGDWREILYQQGGMRPAAVWKRGENMSG